MTPEEELAAAHEECGRLERALTRAIARITTAQTQLQETTAQRDALQTELTNARTAGNATEIVRLRGELRVAEQNVREKQRILDAARQQETRLNNRIDELSDEIRDLEEENHAMSERLRHTAAHPEPHTLHTSPNVRHAVLVVGLGICGLVAFGLALSASHNGGKSQALDTMSTAEINAKVDAKVNPVADRVATLESGFSEVKADVKTMKENVMVIENKHTTADVPADWSTQSADARYASLIEACKERNSAWNETDEKADRANLAALKNLSAADAKRVFDSCDPADLRTRTADTDSIDTPGAPRPGMVYVSAWKMYVPLHTR